MSHFRLIFLDLPFEVSLKAFHLSQTRRASNDRVELEMNPLGIPCAGFKILREMKRKGLLSNQRQQENLMRMHLLPARQHLKQTVPSKERLPLALLVQRRDPAASNGIVSGPYYRT
jgi:hypothetical protein